MNRFFIRMLTFFLALMLPIGTAGAPLYAVLLSTPVSASDPLLKNTSTGKASVELVSVDGVSSGLTLNNGEEYDLEFVVRDSGMTRSQFESFQSGTKKIAFERDVFRQQNHSPPIFTLDQNASSNGIIYTVSMKAVYKQAVTPTITGEITMSANNNQSTRNFTLDLSKWSGSSSTWDYEIRDVLLYGSNGQILSEVKRNQTISRMVVSVRDNALNYLELQAIKDAQNIEVSLNSDVFRNGSAPSIRDIIPTTSGMSYTIEFYNINYSGKGNQLRLTADYYDMDSQKIVPTRIFSHTVDECKISESSSGADDDEDESSSSEKEIAPPTPNLVISSYDYGGGSVTAASNASLNLNFMNTSRKLAIDNIVMKITMPEAFMLTNSSNTFYFDRIMRQESEHCTINFSVKPNAEPISHAIKIAFSFEVVIMKERKTLTAEQEISIPVSQLNRITLNPVEVPEQIYMGERGNGIEASFINKGKSTVYNVSLSIEGTNLAQKEQTQFIGNLESGKENTADFTLDGIEAGPITGEIVLTYEDANMNVSQLRTPFSTQAMTMNRDMGEMPPPEPETEPAIASAWYMGIPGWYWTVGIFVLLIMFAFSIRLARTVHVKKLEAEEDEDI